MARYLIGGVVCAAAGVGVGALLIANRISSGGDRPAVLVALYIVFLVATLTVLAGGLAYSQTSVDQLAAARAAAPRRSLRAATMRMGKRVRRQAGVAARHGATFAARTSRVAALMSRAGARQLGAGTGRLRAQLEAALTPERRHALLTALGLEEPAGADGATAPARPAARRYAAAHARRKVPATSAVTRRYNAFEAGRGARSRVARAASR